MTVAVEAVSSEGEKGERPENRWVGGGEEVVREIEPSQRDWERVGAQVRQRVKGEVQLHD